MPGADEPLTFRLIQNEGAIRSYLENLGLQSKGELLSYDIDLATGTIIAFDQTGADNGSGFTDYDPGAGDRRVFQLTLSSNGDWSFNLYDQMDHDPPYDTDPAGFVSQDPTASGDTATADQNTDLMDNDDPNGDPRIFDVDTIDFGHIIEAVDFDGDAVVLEDKLLISIRDDIPTSASLSITSGTLIHDETPGDDGSDDVNPSGALDALFATVVNKGNDPHVANISGDDVIGYAQDTFTINASVNYGADGPGANSPQYALAISVEDVLSGLQTTEGLNIRLQNEGGIIVGRVDSDGNGSVNTGDPAAFALRVDPATGQITVVQYLSIKHDDRGDNDESNDNGNNANDALPDDPLTVQQFLATGTVSLTATFTDFDGDSITASTDISNRVIFEDDGPSSATLSITSGTLIHDETPGVRRR